MKFNETEVREGYARLTKYLIERKLTITSMESATSGQIASLITDTEGSSAVLKGAFVTYSNEAKIMQGVPKDTIEKYGVYSKETACAMAQASADTYRADIGIGVTGTFGNADPANADSIPGQVYFAIRYDGTTYAFEEKLESCPDRLMYKIEMAGLVLGELESILDKTAENKGRIRVNDKCNGCGLCVVFCPKRCIDISRIPVLIKNEICDGCGACIPFCPLKSIEKSN